VRSSLLYFLGRLEVDLLGEEVGIGRALWVLGIVSGCWVRIHLAKEALKGIGHVGVKGSCALMLDLVQPMSGFDERKVGVADLQVWIVTLRSFWAWDRGRRRSL